MTVTKPPYMTETFDKLRQSNIEFKHANDKRRAWRRIFYVCKYELYHGENGHMFTLRSDDDTNITASDMSIFLAELKKEIAADPSKSALLPLLSYINVEEYNKDPYFLVLEDTLAKLQLTSHNDEVSWMWDKLVYCFPQFATLHLNPAFNRYEQGDY